jgi:hypothetical protein
MPAHTSRNGPSPQWDHVFVERASDRRHGRHFQIALAEEEDFLNEVSKRCPQLEKNRPLGFHSLCLPIIDAVGHRERLEHDYINGDNPLAVVYGPE